MAAKFAQNVPKKVSIDCIRYLCQINEGHIYVLMLFMTFFLQLPGSKYHVNCAASAQEPALRIRQDKINHVLEKNGEREFSQHFACFRGKGDVTTVAIFCSVTLLLVCKNNVGIFPLLWETLSGPAVKDKIMQPSVKTHPPYLMISAGMLSGPAVLLFLRLRMAFSTSTKDGGSSSFGMIGSVGRSSRKPGSVVWTLFGRYSAHLATINTLFLLGRHQYL